MGLGRVIIVLIGRDNLMVSFSVLMARFSSAAIYGQRLNETSWSLWAKLDRCKVRTIIRPNKGLILLQIEIM